MITLIDGSEQIDSNSRNEFDYIIKSTVNEDDEIILDKCFDYMSIYNELLSSQEGHVPFNLARQNCNSYISHISPRLSDQDIRILKSSPCNNIRGNQGT